MWGSDTVRHVKCSVHGTWGSVAITTLHILRTDCGPDFSPGLAAVWPPLSQATSGHRGLKLKVRKAPGESGKQKGSSMVTPPLVKAAWR